MPRTINADRAARAFNLALTDTEGLIFRAYEIKISPTDGNEKFSCKAESESHQAAGDVQIKPQGIRVNITFVAIPGQGEKFTSHHCDYYHI